MAIPNATPRVLVIGANGLLGRSLFREYTRRGTTVRAAKIEWSHLDRVAEDLRTAVAELLSASGDEPWRIVWAAGAGVTSTAQADLAAESRAQNVLITTITSLSANARAQGAVFYASSAGGVYAGSVEPPFSELTEPRPLAAYGHAKLIGERSFGHLSEAGVRVAVGRLANLYGPGQNLSKQQGLISQLSRAHHTGAPINVYVSLDTLRDYLYAEDAARLVIDFFDSVASRPVDTGTVTKILASGRSVSVAALLGEMNRIVRRQVPVVLAASPHSQQQARDLRLRSVVLPELDRRATTPLAVGVAATNADVGARFRMPSMG
ncbi:UDP-glucose 4-epimerase [Sanguibacter gelidistatuariae]|uniref:UDP-glucose 4-epimerase n=1 Tax=Sanguibacter gelidistatuariae TaxID=1814289 RepID=A0A1G6XUU0_9MICO|nr:NAD(P)-dependent oxidoreductase [Sanguibacter gelidistatuariae]SDD81900.1 UDP-glucose 4-epimerase [Sanguibacter gelidistatuariae]